MGAMCGPVLPYPLTAKRDFAERALAAASPCIPPWSATGRVRANAAAFAVSCLVADWTGRCIMTLGVTLKQPLSATA